MFSPTVFDAVTHPIDEKNFSHFFFHSSESKKLLAEVTRI